MLGALMDKPRAPGGLPYMRRDGERNPDLAKAHFLRDASRPLSWHLTLRTRQTCQTCQT